jgi:hypothetical protein
MVKYFGDILFDVLQKYMEGHACGRPSGDSIRFNPTSSSEDVSGPPENVATMYKDDDFKRPAFDAEFNLESDFDSD